MLVDVKTNCVHVDESNLVAVESLSSINCNFSLF